MLLNFLKINCSTNVKTLGLRVNNVRNMCLHLTFAYKNCSNFWQEQSIPALGTVVDFMNCFVYRKDTEPLLCLMRDGIHPTFKKLVVV